MTEFWIPGKPVGKERPRKCKNGRFYTPRKTINYERTVGYACRAAMDGKQPLCMGPVAVDVVIYRKRPIRTKGLPPLPMTTPDIDNVLKTILDGLNGVFYKDDSQVVGVSVGRVWDKRDAVRVRVNEIDSLEVV